MKRELILGIGGIACAGAIIGGALLINNDFNFLKKNPEEDYSKKIEALWFEELKDKSKYSFCLGEMDIRSTHSDSLLGANGAIDYTSKEVAVFNKETNRLYVMSRQSKYGYKGVLSKALGGAGLNVPVIEYGSLTENYGKNEMPIRLDYTDKYITTDPEVKNKQWINVLIGEEENLGLPHHGCSGVYTLDNSMGKDLLVGGEQIIINKKCNESLMGASYDGSFEYNCNVIEYKQAMEIIEEYKIEEDLQNTKNKEVFENNEEVEVDSAGERRIDDNDNYDSNNPEDVKKAIEQMKLEMKADQTD